MTNPGFRVRASVLALVFYRNAFSSDMTEAVKIFLSGLSGVLQRDIGETDLILAAHDITELAGKIVWAMYKAEQYARREPAENYKDFCQPDIFDNISELVELLLHGYCAAVNQDETRDSVGSAEYNDFLVLANCKHMGLNFDEMNELTVNSYIELASQYAPDSVNRDGNKLARAATADEAADYFAGI